MEKFLKFTTLLILSFLILVSSFNSTVHAAQVRRFLGPELVEQGFMDVTLDVQGVDNFRYDRQQGKINIYRGKFKPSAKLKISMQANLGKQTKELPITGRTLKINVKVTAKNGSKIIKTDNYNSVNKNKYAVDYVIPGNADSVEIYEVFTVVNKSKQRQYNVSVSSNNKILISTKDNPAVVKNIADVSKLGSSSNSMRNGLIGLALVGAGYYWFKRRKNKLKEQSVEQVTKTKKINDITVNTKEGLQNSINMTSVARENILHQRDVATLAKQRASNSKTRQNTVSSASIKPIAGKKKFCGNCGAPLDGGKFCSNCGAKL